MLKNIPASLLLLTLALLLTGCQSRPQRLTPTIAPGTKPLVCTQWQPLTFEWPGDTEATVRAIRVNNARQRAYCAVM